MQIFSCSAVFVCLASIVAVGAVGCGDASEKGVAVSEHDLGSVGPKGCTSDDQCGGGANMCFIDYCARVEDSSMFLSDVQGLGAAFDGAGALQIAYATRRSPRPPHHLYDEFPLAAGRWGGTPTHVTTLSPRSYGSGSTSAPFGFDRAPGTATLAWIEDGGPNRLAYGDGGSPALPPSRQVSSFSVATNAAGTRFAAFLVHDPRHENTYSLWFASRPANGAWSTLEQVWDPGSPVGIAGIHARKDGSADVLVSFGSSLMRAHRSNPIDSWTLTELATGGRSSEVISTRGADGTTHAVFSSKELELSGDGEAHDSKYIEIGDTDVVRSVPLGISHRETLSVYRNMGVDGAGNVWIQKRSKIGGWVPSVVRVDRDGNVATRSLGELQHGDVLSSSLAASNTGELALVWPTANGQLLNARRIIPIR